MSVIESVKKYVEGFDEIAKPAHFGVNYADAIDLNYAIEEIPNQGSGIREYYMDGTTEREFYFQFVGIFPYSANAATNMEASIFFEKMQDWVETNNNNGELPDMPEGMTPISIEVVSPAYFLGQVSETMGRYHMAIKLIYDREELK